MVQYYATPAVRGGGNTYESNANAYHQQMQAARQPQYGQQSPPTTYSPYGQQTQNLGGQYSSLGYLNGSGPRLSLAAQQNPHYGANQSQWYNQPFQTSSASAPTRGSFAGSGRTMATPAGGIGGGGGAAGGIPGARFGQTGAAFNPQVNEGVNYEYRNPQTGQTYNINRAVSKFQNGLALNSLVNYINALRQQQLGAQGGLTNLNQSGFYGY